jgi:hypothetical protein
MSGPPGSGGRLDSRSFLGLPLCFVFVVFAARHLAHQPRLFR